MAGKRHSFLRSIQSEILEASRSLKHRFLRRGPARFLGGVLLTIFTTIGLAMVTSPALSQLPELQPTAPAQPVPQPDEQPPGPSRLLPEYVSAEQLVNRAMEYYESGEYLAAAEALTEAIEKFEERGDHPLQQAISLGNLSLIYQHMGQWDIAAATLIQGFELIQGEGEDWLDQVKNSLHPQVAARLLGIYGRLNYIQGNPEDALVHWREAGNLYEALGKGASDAEMGQRYRKQLLTSRLNQVQALQTLGRHLQSCVAITDTLNLNTQETLLDCQNDGHASFVKDEPDFKKLVGHVKEIIATYQLNDAEQTSIWQGLGEVLRVLGRLEDSREVLQEGLTIAVNPTSEDVSVARAKHFHDLDEVPEKETFEKTPQLMPLYLSLGNTLTALGELERDRKNSRYENAKSFSNEFGCFAQQADDENSYIADNIADADDTVAEFYQRAALCYRDAVQLEDDAPSNLIALQAQLNQLSLSIDHLSWLIEDAPTLVVTEPTTDAAPDLLAIRSDNAENSTPTDTEPTELDDAEATTEPDAVEAQSLADTEPDNMEVNPSTDTEPDDTLFKGELGVTTAVQNQAKSVDTQISRVDCLLAKVDALPASQAKIYARLNLARNLLKYLEVQVHRSDAPLDLNRLLPTPNQLDNTLSISPVIYPEACTSGKALSSVRFEDLKQTGGKLLWSDIYYLLTTARQEAQDLYQNAESLMQVQGRDEDWQRRLLGNKRYESLAIGNLGYLYETLGNLYAELAQQSGNPVPTQQFVQEAQIFTLEALELAQPDKAPDIAYQWQWQLGRLLAQQGLEKHNDAISAYKIAVDTLEKARKNLSTIDSEAQFSFRDNVEPVYRELIDLLLQPEHGQEEPGQDNLKAAIVEVGELQLAELENFLRCNVPGLTPVETIQDPTAAIIHTILHGESLTLIVKLPGQEELISKTNPVNQRDANLTVEKLFQALSEADIDTAYAEGKKVYNWLISPIRSTLDTHVKDGTLVFVLDSFLRKTPMAFLNNGANNYLIQDYAIAFAPRQEIFTSSIERGKLSVFAGGFGTPQEKIEGQAFSSILFLEKELNAIGESGASVSDLLLDEDFTIDNIAQELDSGRYSTIHLKTHGQFSSNPNETFLLASKGLIKPNDLRGLIQIASESRGQPIDLLVLSACSAAEGDDRAILGLAGIATVTGTRSAVSALWAADDRFNTEFMQAFYEELAIPGTTKAKALQRAQLRFVGGDQQHWSNYILVGDWR